MLTARYYGIGDVRIESVDMPEIGPDEVLVKVTYAGICGSDLHIYGKGMFISSIPSIMGHEFSGTVTKVGEKAAGFAVGDPVIGDPRVGCGSCDWCRSRQYNLCPSLGFIGEVSPGCFAEYIVMPTEKLIKIPKELDLRLAALVEPLAVAIHIARLGQISAGDKLGIIGAGPIGLLTLLVANHLKAQQVTVVDTSAVRLGLASQMGAVVVLQKLPDEQSDPMDVVVEAAGKDVTLRAAIKWLKPEGRLVIGAIYEDNFPLDINEVVVKEMRIVGINAYGTEDLHHAVEYLVNGYIDAASIISHELPLESAADGFAMLMAKEKNAVKVLLKP